VSLILQRASRARGADLEAWESSLRAAVLSAGAKALEGLLRSIGWGRPDAPVVCACGGLMQSKGLKHKPLLTILGPVSYSRSMFQCSVCRKTRYPGDEALDVVNTTRSPGMRRMMGRAGSRSTFKEGREDLKIYAGIQVSAKDVERVAEGIGEDMEVWSRKEREQILREDPPVRSEKDIPVLYLCYDGTGVPMIPSELKGRKGKQPDGSAKTREVKLGCVFTQTSTHAEGFPVRDPDSTSFVGAIESSEPFGWRIYAEALRRGLLKAKKVVVLGDGAPWVKILAQMHFPEAIQIIDLYHAKEHVSDLCKLLFGGNEKKVSKYRLQWWSDLEEGAVEKIIRQSCRHLSTNPADAKKQRKQIAYLHKNKERMRYADFRAQGLFIGSGVVEAGCKSVIGHRLKQSGMEWSVRGANAIISLRCMMKSGRLEDYWESRCG
jgi:hypothetical protein